jgi:hypothetical protein
MGVQVITITGFAAYATYKGKRRPRGLGTAGAYSCHSMKHLSTTRRLIRCYVLVLEMKTESSPALVASSCSPERYEFSISTFPLPLAYARTSSYAQGNKWNVQLLRSDLSAGACGRIAIEESPSGGAWFDAELCAIPPSHWRDRGR